MSLTKLNNMYNFFSIQIFFTKAKRQISVNKNCNKKLKINFLTQTFFFLEYISLFKIIYQILFQQVDNLFSVVTLRFLQLV